jgi:hypothetical protein
MFPSHLATRAPEHLTIRVAALRNPHQHQHVAASARRTRRATGRRFRRP